MLFFILCVAPVSNKILDDNNKSKFLRNIFPKNFSSIQRDKSNYEIDKIVLQ